MDTQNNKRTRKELDNEQADVESTGSFPRFLTIESLKPDNPLSKMSSFVIEKVLVSVAGSPKSVKKLRNGNFLVEVEKPRHLKNLLSLERFLYLFPQNVHLMQALIHLGVLSGALIWLE